MNIALLIIHGLMAVMLLGAVTHQAAAAVWPRRPGQRGLASRFRGVNAAGYTNTIVILYVLTFILGGYIYIIYRIEVRPPLEVLLDLPTIGLFELKEHFLSVTFGMLPAYWYYWTQRPDMVKTRATLAVWLALSVWFGLVVGHLVNNVRGFV